MTTYGIYRERARSAVLSTVMLDRAAAIAHAEALTAEYGPHLVAEFRQDQTRHGAYYLAETLRYNDPGAPRYIARCGDWDSRSAWQPYPAPGAVIR